MTATPEYSTPTGAVNTATDQITSRGYQRVWCTTGSKGEPIPQPGTTGDIPFPIATLPSETHSRPALRPPLTIAIQDVDDHAGDGTGPATIKAMEEKLGKLPPTWKLTAHGSDVAHGRFLYRIPADLIINNRPFKAYGGSVDSVRTGWRFSMAPGDIHPKTKQPVVCYDANGQPSELPLPDEVPSYPDKWLEYFRNFPVQAGEACAAVEAGDLPDPMPALVQKELDRPESERPANAEGTGPSLHTAVIRLVHACFDAGLSQEETTAVAVELSPYARALADQRRSGAEHEVARAWGQVEAKAPDEAEWLTDGRVPNRMEQMMSCDRDLAVGVRRGLISIQVAKISANGRGAGWGTPGQAGAGSFVEDTAEYSGDQRSGAENGGEKREPAPFVFDTADAHDDQALAEACLYASLGWARFAADAELWLTYGQECWTSHASDKSAWIVSQLSPVMPFGISPKLVKKDDALDPEDPLIKADMTRYTNRVTCRSAAGAGRVATKMRSLVAVAGRHQMTLLLSDLDADPNIIWAGGTPWDIRASTEKLTAAELAPGTPHLKTCRYRPDSDCATPLWDAFLAVVWPEEAIRLWALRLASLAVAGYGDKAFPILSGPTDAGKTSFVMMIADLLGNYAISVAPELLTGGSGSSMEYARFALKGARLAFMDEAPRTGKLAQSALKALTGGADVHGRPPYGKTVQFRPSHTLIATANPESDPPLGDLAVRERIRLVGCYGSVTAVRTAWEALFPLDGKAWQREAPGVLAQLIMRAAEVLADPSLIRNEKAPDEIKLWTALMADEQDTVALWKASETEPAPANVKTRSHELHDDYVAWCRRKEMRAESSVHWGRRMVALGAQSEKAQGVMWYRLKVRYRPYGGFS